MDATTPQPIREPLADGPAVEETAGPASAGSPGRAGRALDRLLRHPAGGIVVIFAAVQLGCIVWSVMSPDFAWTTHASVQVLLDAVPALGIVALGVGILMIAGEFDLSVGSTFVLAPLVMAKLYNDGTPLLICIAAALGVGALVGLLNATITLRAAIPSFIATLGTMMFVRSVVLYVSASEGENFLPGHTTSEALGGHIDLIPAQFLWLIALAVGAALLLNGHRLGNRLFAVGGNLPAARNIGVHVTRVKTSAFVLSGMAAATAGVFSAVRTQSISPIEGQGLELQAIAACVIGGVALTGGRGSVLGMFLGAFLIYTIQQVLLLLGAPGYYLDGFVAVVIVVAVVLNRALQRNE